MRKKKVNEDEVVKFYTEILRNPEDMGFKATDSMKAAEFFSKYLNILEKNTNPDGSVTIIDDIGGNNGE